MFEKFLKIAKERVVKKGENLKKRKMNQKIFCSRRKIRMFVGLFPYEFENDVFRWFFLLNFFSVKFVEWSWRSKTTTSTPRTEIVRLEVRWNGLRSCGTEMCGCWWRRTVMLRAVTNWMICPRRWWIGSSQSVSFIFKRERVSDYNSLFS